MLLDTHLGIYVTAFIASFTSAYWNNYYYTSCLILGWSIFGLVSVGHELYHLHHRSILQSIIAFLCLDLWVVNGNVWVEKHNRYHHPNVWKEGEKEHMIGGSPVDNFFHTIIALATTYKVLLPTWSNLLLMTFRLWFFNLLGLQSAIIVYTTIIMCVTYLTFITHAAPVIDENEERDLKQMHRSIDIFPDSWLITLICGGFNIHAAHHLSPHKTRGELLSLHTYYKSKYPNDYRYITSWYQLWLLYKYRHFQFSNMKDWSLMMSGKINYED
jgi:fatty acid desaturase